MLAMGAFASAIVPSPRYGSSLKHVFLMDTSQGETALEESVGAMNSKILEQDRESWQTANG